MSKATRRPPLAVTDTGVSRGRRELRAVYPSSRPGVPPHTTSGTDDGRVTACTCPGWLTTGKCWHESALVDDYWRARWGGEPLAALQWRTLELLHWLNLGPDAADADAARHELDTLGDIIGARMTESEAA